MSCRDCRFWVVHARADRGDCHRRAPIGSQWPATFHDDWCGDYAGAAKGAELFDQMLAEAARLQVEPDFITRQQPSRGEDGYAQWRNWVGELMVWPTGKVELRHDGAVETVLPGADVWTPFRAMLARVAALPDKT